MERTAGNKILQRLTLLLGSAILLFMAWPPHWFAPLMYIAFVPLLFFFNSLWDLSVAKRFIYSFLGLMFVLFLFGYGTSYNAWGQYDDNVHVAALMSVWPEAFFVSFFVIFRKQKWAFLFIIFSWGSVEVLQTSWEMNAPLFMIGNGLSTFPSLIQHYSLWGVLGGTMHILAINVMFYYMVKKIREKQSVKKASLILCLLFIPTILSVITFLIPREKPEYKVAIAIGHFDHFKKVYSDKPMLLVNKYNKLLEKVDLAEVSLVMFPESGIVNGGWIENLNKVGVINPMDSLCPGKEIFVGSHMFSIYNGQDPDSYNVRYHELSKMHFVSHNCIVFRNELGNYRVRAKEKYIPFHESVPYPSVFLFAKDWFNKDAVPTYLSKYPKAKEGSFNTSKGIKINPLMCFESTFSDMAVRNKDAHFTLVLANESWNSEDRGKRQYNDYLAAKAIESGKGILKVANGGYSGFISSNGMVKNFIGFDKPTAQIIEIEIDDSASFYSKFSGGIASLTVMLTFLLVFIEGIKRIFKSKQA